MTTIIAVCNQKGGVGKSTVTLGLADRAAERGLRPLVIDADPQANATAGLGINDTPPFTLNDVLASERDIEPGIIVDAVVPTERPWGKVDLVAAELALAAREQDQMIGREGRLRTAIGDSLNPWDLVLIDCPPSLGQLTVNALAAASAALLVTEPRASSVEGLAQIVRTIGSVRQYFNPAIAVGGVVVNKHRPDRVDRAEWVETIRQDYDTHLIDAFIPEREVIAVAASAAAPLSAYGARAREVNTALDAILTHVLDPQEVHA